MEQVTTDDLRRLKDHERFELIKLLHDHVLLQTRIDDWLQSPNEFVPICIPKEVKDFLLFLTGESEQAATEGISALVKDLILLGIGSLAKKHEDGGARGIMKKIDKILEEGIKIQ